MQALQLVAHRGHALEYPENTLPAFASALQLGVRHLELDVQLSRDRVPIVLHDSRQRVVRVEAERNDALLAARGELLGPARLINRVQDLGMVPGAKTRTLHVDAETVAYIEIFTPQPSRRAGSGTFAGADEGSVKAAVGANP